VRRGATAVAWRRSGTSCAEVARCQKRVPQDAPDIDGVEQRGSQQTPSAGTDQRGYVDGHANRQRGYSRARARMRFPVRGAKASRAEKAPTPCTPCVRRPSTTQRLGGVALPCRLLSEPENRRGRILHTPSLPGESRRKGPRSRATCQALKRCPAMRMTRQRAEQQDRDAAVQAGEDADGATSSRPGEEGSELRCSRRRCCRCHTEDLRTLRSTGSAR
jgi:hypothetical protein